MNPYKRLIFDIQSGLALGQFIAYKQSGDFIRTLIGIHAKVDKVAGKEKSPQMVEVYELFLAGCYQKANEIASCGGSLGEFFLELFLSWIRARQGAECDPAQTVQIILHWQEKDDFCYLYESEGRIAEVLDEKEWGYYRWNYEKEFATVLDSPSEVKPKGVDQRVQVLRHKAQALKKMYGARKEISRYISFCEHMGTTPRDCETVAKMYQSDRHHEEALSWAEKGLILDKTRNWGSGEGAWALDSLKQELLHQLGRTDEAMKLAWVKYQQSPCEIYYTHFMEYVSSEERKEWHAKAMNVAHKARLHEFIALCAMTKEWRLLADRIERESDEALENITHYVTEKAAKALEKRFPLAAAKVYRALGMRILKAKKSKYYSQALKSFAKYKTLCEATGQEQAWLEMVEAFRRDHKRKIGFIGRFEKIVQGTAFVKEDTFESRMREIWRKHI